MYCVMFKIYSITFSNKQCIKTFMHVAQCNEKENSCKNLPVSPSSGLVDKDDFSGIPFNEYKNIH